MAAGGALGGAFTALLAPLLFDGVFEYPIALVAACLLRPALAPGAGRRILDFALPIGRHPDRCPQRRGCRTAGLWHARAAARVRAERSGALCAGRAAAGLRARHRGGLRRRAARRRCRACSRERSFFGVYTVKRDPAGYHVLLHGTTMHGAQRLDADRRREPLTYFHRDGPLGTAVPRRRRARAP